MVLNIAMLLTTFWLNLFVKTSYLSRDNRATNNTEEKVYSYVNASVVARWFPLDRV